MNVFHEIRDEEKIYCISSIASSLIEKILHEMFVEKFNETFTFPEFKKVFDFLNRPEGIKICSTSKFILKVSEQFDPTKPDDKMIIDDYDDDVEYMANKISQFYFSSFIITDVVQKFKCDFTRYELLTISSVIDSPIGNKLLEFIKYMAFTAHNILDSEVYNEAIAPFIPEKTSQFGIGSFLTEPCVVDDNLLSDNTPGIKMGSGRRPIQDLEPPSEVPPRPLKKQRTDTFNEKDFTE